MMTQSNAVTICPRCNLKADYAAYECARCGWEFGFSTHSFDDKDTEKWTAAHIPLPHPINQWAIGTCGTQDACWTLTPGRLNDESPLVIARPHWRVELWFRDGVTPGQRRAAIDFFSTLVTGKED